MSTPHSWIIKKTTFTPINWKKKHLHNTFTGFELLPSNCHSGYCPSGSDVGFWNLNEELFAFLSWPMRWLKLIFLLSASKNGPNKDLTGDDKYGELVTIIYAFTFLFFLPLRFVWGSFVFAFKVWKSRGFLVKLVDLIFKNCQASDWHGLGRCPTRVRPVIEGANIILFNALLYFKLIFQERLLLSDSLSHSNPFQLSKITSLFFCFCYSSLINPILNLDAASIFAFLSQKFRMSISLSLSFYFAKKIR